MKVMKICLINDKEGFAKFSSLHYNLSDYYSTFIIVRIIHTNGKPIFKCIEKASCMRKLLNCLPENIKCT